MGAADEGGVMGRNGREGGEGREARAMSGMRGEGRKARVGRGVWAGKGGGVRVEMERPRRAGPFKPG